MGFLMQKKKRELKSSGFLRAPFKGKIASFFGNKTH